MSEIEELCKTLLEKASEKGKTVSLAESCTGGLIGASITALPGSSSVFMGSAVTYSNDAKEDILGVPKEILETHGAVSSETACAMAIGSRRIYHSDAAVSVTGIAGPGGATDTKPVGLVYIGIDDGNGARADRFVFTGNRDSVREQTVINALKILIGIL